MRSRLVLTLAVLVIAVVALAGWLLGRAARAPDSTISQTIQVGDLQVTMELDQAALGQRIVEVAVQDIAGRPADVRAVRLRFMMAEMDMGQIEADALPLGQGRYRARGTFFTMVGLWNVDTTIQRDGQPALSMLFAFPIAAPGEASGPRNPLAADLATRTAGQRLYAANCVVCHGPTGKGDGPSAAGLNPRPADFSQHMVAGKHTDGQVFLWIKNGFPGTAMPAWSGRLSDEQIWQVVTYVRTFGQSAAAAGGAQSGTAAPAQQLPTQTQPAPVPNVREPLPPLILVRQGNLWRSDGSQAPLRQLTYNAADSFAQNPAISPDGKQVAYVTLIQPSATAELPVPTSALFVINIDGSGARQVWKPAEGLLGMPAWAPDGRSLYVAANGVKSVGSTSGQQLQIVRVDLASGGTQSVLDNTLDPTFSRDGGRMAFLQLGQDGFTMSLLAANADGSGAQVLIDGKQFQGFFAPRFSPDGKRLVVAAIGGPQTDDRGNPVSPPSGATPLDRLLALLAPATAEAHGLPWDLWAINVDGSGLRRLTQFYEDLPMAVFSPDGKQIAVMGAGGIYLLDADGANLRRIDPVGDHGGLDWVR
ncbi:MAG TPA: LpqB family beta-propeller domain-containing protein [Roseiflexaceae bacterium]|nr:LpqB family beta-propeller domain-containing protein [Roseiflexaceae bacterium]